MNSSPPQLPIQALERIDDRCAEFEKAWQSDAIPNIEDFVNGVDRDNELKALLSELIALDLDYRQRRGETPQRDDYVERFSDYKTLIDGAFGRQRGSSNAFELPSIDRLRSLFPHLDIIKALGAGGMGAVFKAKQKGLDRWVALKVLPNELAMQPQFPVRFTREARTLAKLNHPNIVSVFEFGQVERTYYFLMEFVDGPTLRDVIRAGNLSPGEALAIVPHLCDALQYAHDRGVIHRDIKPENILLTHDGAIKVVDFGLARLAGSGNGADGLTGTHQVMGTPRYMAPEQFTGTRNVDHRADIYSMGVVFYELLTGELPQGRFAVPSKKVAIDVRLDEVVLKTLEKEPDLRYQTADSVRVDVDSIVSSTDPSDDVTQPMAAMQSHDPETIASQPARRAPNADSEAHLLLTRRGLMSDLQRSLNPIRRWQWLQLLLGIGLIALGAYGWTRNTNVPHRLISGLIVHIYGVLMIAAAIKVLVCLKDVDTTEPIEVVRHQLRGVRNWYMRLTPVLGLAWWWIWIPVAVSAGFDEIMHPRSFYPSVIVGMIGFGVSLLLVHRSVRTHRHHGNEDQSQLAAASLRTAFMQLNEIERTGIR